MKLFLKALKHVNWNITKQPFIVNKETANNESYLFNTEFNKITSILNNKSTDSSNSNNTHNPVISIVGERGSGKSSLLHTLSKSLSTTYLVIGPIDPNIFSNSMKLTELVLTEIYNKLKDLADCPNSNDSLIQQTFRNISTAMSVLTNIRISKDNYAENYTTTEIMEDLSSRYTFEKLINEITLSILSLTFNNDSKENKLIILIDDLDLISNITIYDLMEDIRKYFSSSATILISYRYSQLKNAIISSFLKENQLLIDNKQISIEEIKNQAIRYIDKFAPPSNRVYLPSTDTIHNLSFHKLFHDILTVTSNNSEDIKNYFLNMDKNITFTEFIGNIILTTCRLSIMPFNELENSPTIFPDNLRGAMELIQTFQDFDTVIENNSIDAQANETLGNLQIYNSYVHKSIVDFLNPKQLSIINNWSSKKIEHKNYQLYYDLFYEFEISERKDFLDISYVQPENVSIGDIFCILEKYMLSFRTESNTDYFVYIIKLLYSMELLRLYVTAIKEISDNISESPSLNQFVTLLNHYIIPIYLQNELSLEYARLYPNLEFSYNPSPYDNTNEIKRFISYICYTDISPKGNIGPAVRKNVSIDAKHKNSFKYRHYFKSLSPLEKDLQINTTYPFDLFAFLGNSYYIKDSIKQIIKNSTNPDSINNNYVLYSMFDIDRFLVHNYTRRSERAPLKYWLQQIDKLVQKTHSNRIRGIRLHDLLPPVFVYNNKDSYNPVYDHFLQTENETIDRIFLSEISSNETSITADPNVKSDEILKILVDSSVGTIKETIDFIFMNYAIQPPNKHRAKELIPKLLNLEDIFDLKIQNGLNNLFEHWDKPKTRVSHETAKYLLKALTTALRSEKISSEDRLYLEDFAKEHYTFRNR